MAFFQSLRRKFYAPAGARVDILQWREYVLSNILFIVTVLGSVTCVPSVLLALSEKRWFIVAIDVAALIWMATIWRKRTLPFFSRAWGFLFAIYLLGLFFLYEVGPVGLAFLMAFPAMAALLLGLRSALFALGLNAATLLAAGYLANSDMDIAGFAGRTALQWIIITINFMFIDAVITISTAVLLHGLEKSLKRQRAILLSLEEGQKHLRMANDELRLTSAALARLNDMVLIMEADSSGQTAPRIAFVNDAFERRTGYVREDLIGRKPYFLQGSRASQMELSRIREAMYKWEPVQGETVGYSKSGEEFMLEFDIVPVADTKGGFTHWVAVVRDITERKKAEEDIHRLAYYDALTGLPNRRLLMDRMHLLLATARHTSSIGAVLYIDLDHFKNVNDARGHTVGDTLLQSVAHRLSELIREEDTVGHLGGDEFVILVTHLGQDPESSARDAMAIADNVRKALEQPFQIDGQPHMSGGSIGVTLLPKEGQTAEDLLREADTAMYRAKAAGRNRIAFFESTMQSEVEERLALERDLAHAIELRQLAMYLQPQVDHAGRHVGAELLMRWTCPVRGPVSPAVFIPLAEETGMILRMGDWALREGCKTLLRLKDAGRPLPLSINVSPSQFRQPDFVEQVCSVLAETGAPASELIFEVTEGLLIESLDDAIARMNELAALGIRFSIDDFGTGYSSLAYLKRLPLYELKIDKEFVQDTCSDSSDAAIVCLILSMAKHLGLRVVAEGVETLEQADFLAANGCDAMQGFLFDRPMPVDEWLTRNNG